jgi:hypothetical protein
MHTAFFPVLVGRAILRLRGLPTLDRDDDV